VLVFEPVAAAALLAALDGFLPGDVVLGGSAGYLAAVARFAGDLVARGRVLPALVTEDGGYAARWRPVLAGADAGYARELAAAMPAVCRAALANPGADSVAGTAPGFLLADMLDALADATARTRLPAVLLPARKGRRPSRIPVSERTVASLTTTAALVEVATPEDEREARELSAAFAVWLASTAPQGGSDRVRTCFRLVEPAEPDAAAEPGEPTEPDAAGGPHAAAGLGNWQLEFSLQSAEDPSLMLPAADVWAGTGFGWLAADARPEEELLAGLGTAARLFPALDEALREAAPVRIALDAAGALEFLRETGPLLSGAGFGVLLPDWARKAKLGLKLTARSSAGGSTASARQRQFGMEDLVSFRYDLAVGDEVLSAAELAELARLKVPLVRVRGQWVELDDQHLKAALKFLERKQSATMTAAEVLRTAIGGGGDVGELAVTSVDADGWLGDLLSGQADQRLEPMQTPDRFAGTLRPYQQRGLSWLSFLGRLGVGAILADDMGLGKTVQLLSLLSSGGTTPRTPRGAPDGTDRHRIGRASSGGMTPRTPRGAPDGTDRHRIGRASSGGTTPREGDEWTDNAKQQPVIHESACPTLLICPMSLVGNWQREARRFTPELRVHVHHGAGRLSGAELEATMADADLVITTYQTAARDLAALSRIGWSRVVCDEAQAIKNHLSQQAKAVRALPARTRIALTGTPVENQLSELWSIMEFANPGLLGSAKEFRERFSVPIERHGDEEAAAGLRRVTQPFVLRRLKTDKSIISDLPEKQEMKVWCNLTQEQASLYAATVSDMLAKIESAEGISRRGLVLATMAKLKQACNHPAHLLGDGSRLAGRSGKLARLEELCEEIIADGDKALLFTQYAEFGRMLQPYLTHRTGAQVLFLHGGNTKKQRDTMVARFQDSSEPLLFLLSLKAGGTGLNLTAANHVIHVDRWWNPAVEDQATDRAFRIGQRRDVQVRKFVCVGTLEEKIDAMIEQKKALAEQIVGTGESWLTELSTAALREVLALSPEAVSS
jgi:SNF2 family DNA or RNA helicase